MKQNTVRIPPSRSSGSIRIGTKIFALVGFLLVLLGAIAGLGIWQMNKIGVEIEEIAQRVIPLTRDLTEITIHQLEQAVNFERAFRAGQVMNEYAGGREEFDKAVRIFAELTGKIEREFGEVKVIARRALDAPLSEEERQDYQSMLTMLGKLDAEHEDYDRLSRKAFKLIDAGQLKQALVLLPKIEAEEQDLDYQLGKMLLEVEGFTQTEVNEIDEHERFALKLLAVISAIALITGTVASVYIVRRNISRPLSEIATGLEALGADDMSVEVKIYHDDEIGAVAKAYTDFKKTLKKLKKREQELKSEYEKTSKLNIQLTTALEARKKAQSALSASWRRFVDIAEMSPDWIWECDEKFLFTYVSDNFITAAGMSRKKILGRRWAEIGAKSGARKLCDNLESKQPFHGVKITMPSQGGKSTRWLISGRPVFSDAGKFAGYRGIGSDMAEVKRSGEEAGEYSGRLEEWINLAVMEDANLDTTNVDVKLTPREREILDWVKQGKSYADIAEILAISRRTIEFHIANVMNKLGASNRVSAVVIAMRRGILGS